MMSKPAHYKIKRNDRAFWEPTRQMRDAGFKSVPLGPDSDEARRVAEAWNARWGKVRRGECRLADLVQDRT